jgi:hypothetical protein
MDIPVRLRAFEIQDGQECPSYDPTQREACRILKLIGTKASIPALEAASKNKNRMTVSAAKDALNTIKAR